jgi:hypothetical protein
VKLHYRTRPRRYQVPALKFVIRNGGGGLFVPMRWGKSWVAINACAAWYLRDGVRKALIVCPNDVVDVWVEQIQEHCPVPYAIYDKDGMPMASAWGAGPKLNFQIRNYEAIYDRIREHGGWSGITDRYLIDWDPEVVVVDESHMIGNPGALQAKKVVQVGRMARFRLFMTGTPWHRKPIYVFGMFKFYDESVLGSNFKQFKEMITIRGGYGGYKILRYTNLRWLRDKIRPHVFVRKRVPKTPPTHRRIAFSLDKSRPTYDKMEKEDIIHVAGEDVEAPIILTRHLRLQQIAGGWVKAREARIRGSGPKRNWRCGAVWKSTVSRKSPSLSSERGSFRSFETYSWRSRKRSTRRSSTMGEFLAKSELGVDGYLRILQTVFSSPKSMPPSKE